jgi:hypothetical protein
MSKNIVFLCLVVIFLPNLAFVGEVSQFSDKDMRTLEQILGGVALIGIALFFGVFL